MSALARKIIAKLAHRVHEDPTAASVEDAKKMAAALLLLLEGKLP